jgi:hypothetical protein
MNERFFGPWRIELVSVLNVIRSQVVIFGSSGADGAYDNDPNQPFTISVDGESWTLGIESWWPDTGFSPQPVRRTYSFGRMDGLVAVVKMGQPPVVVGSIGPVYEYVRVRYVSQDPTITPLPPSNPFDFTLPEH